MLATAALAAVIALSLAWWQADVARCACEVCPDEHCLYAEHVLAALRTQDATGWQALLEFARGFIHAQNPLAAVLAAVLGSALPSVTTGFVVASLLATLLAWCCVRSSVTVWRPRATTVLLLAVAFASNAIVVRGLARPINDAIGMACTIATLLALTRYAARPTGGRAAGVFCLQLVGLLARPSYIPMLGMPAVAALLGEGTLAQRAARAVRAGIVLGLLPGLGYLAIIRALGIEHTAWMWQLAHQPRYVPDDRTRELMFALVYAGGPYLLLGAAALVVPRWRTPAGLLHLAWIALYVTFLATGGGSLWLRYFAPIVPSVVIVATPALDAAIRRRRTLAVAAVALVALLHVVKVVRTMTASPPPAAQPGQALRTGSS